MVKTAIAGVDQRRETAQYMADMLLELRNMANNQKFANLSSLLELSFCEAFAIANFVKPPEGEIAKITALSQAARKG